MAELVARTRALFAAGRPLCDRVGPRPPLRDAPHLARRLEHPRPHRGRRLRRLPAPSAPRASWPRPASPGAPGAGPGPRHEPVRDGSPARAAAASTTPSGCCPTRSAGRSTPSTRSAAWWTTAWTSRAAEGEAGLARWIEEVQRCYAGKPETELGRELAEAVFQFPDPPVVLRGHRGRLPHGPDRRPLRDLRRPARLLPARGVRGGPRVDRDLRLRGPRHPRATRSSWASPSSSRTSCATWPWTRRATGSTCPSKTSRRFGVSEDAVFEAARAPAGPRPPAIDALLAFEAERARAHFERGPTRPARRRPSLHALGRDHGRRLPRACSRRSRAAASRWALPVVRLSRPRKAAIALRTVPRVYWRPVKVVVVGGGFAGLAAAIAPPGEAPRGDAARAARRAGRPRHVLPRRALRRGRGQRHPPHDRRLPGHPRPHAPRRAASDLLLEQDDLRIDYVDDAGPTVAALPAAAGPVAPARRPLRRCACPGRCGSRRCASASPCASARRPRASPSPSTSAAPARGPRRARLLWDPLAIAIVNETPERAAAILFHRVYQEAFLASRRASRLVFLRCGWGDGGRAAGAATSRRGEGRCIAGPWSTPSRSTGHE